MEITNNGNNTIYRTSTKKVNLILPTNFSTNGDNTIYHRLIFFVEDWKLEYSAVNMLVRPTRGTTRYK